MGISPLSLYFSLKVARRATYVAGHLTFLLSKFKTGKKNQCYEFGLKHVSYCLIHIYSSFKVMKFWKLL